MYKQRITVFAKKQYDANKFLTCYSWWAPISYTNDNIKTFYFGELNKGIKQTLLY